jgi:hypothetical protein
MKKPSRAGGKPATELSSKASKLKRNIVPKAAEHRSSAMQQIAGWLDNLGMSEYAERFSENKIDVSVLRHLTDQDLKDIGVALGHRRTTPTPRPGSCFLAGTRIQSAKGEVCIEELQIGDGVLTISGRVKQIKFIGHRRVSREPSQSWTGAGPVKISRFAIDGKAPHSDLYVSAWHAIYIDSILIPAKYLVNGVTIVADAKPEALSLTYFHIELDTHEAILAEGLAVESFLRDNPHAFDNADEYVRLYGSPEEPLTPFAPYVSYTGRQELASHIRSALAPVYDFRKPIDKVRDRIVDRAEFARAA